MSFKDWLIVNKEYGRRSASDAQSRMKRALGIVGEVEVTDDTLLKLEATQDFQNLSIHIKSQLRRAIALYNEYRSNLKIGDN